MACVQVPESESPDNDVPDASFLTERALQSHLARLEGSLQARFRTIERKIDHMLTHQEEEKRRPRGYGGHHRGRRGSVMMPRRYSMEAEEPLPLSEIMENEPTQCRGRKGLVHASGVPRPFLHDVDLENTSQEGGGVDLEFIRSEASEMSRPQNAFDANSESSALDVRTPSRMQRGGSCDAMSESSVLEKRTEKRLTRDHPLLKIDNLPLTERRRLTELMDFQKRVAVRDKFRGERADQIWRFLEEIESSPSAQYYAHFTTLLITGSVIITLLQTGNPPPLEGIWPSIVELSIDFIFLLEFLVRWSVSPHKSLFFCNAFNLIDMTGVFTFATRLFLIRPGYILDFPATVIIEETLWSILLCVVPVIRLLKLLRRFEKFQLLLHAFELAFEALPVLLFTGAIILLVASSVIFFCEPRDNMDSLPRAMWLTIVTMTTVGYGDFSPTSMWGTVATSFLLVASALYMAIPLGIVGNAFNSVWEDRDRLLLMQRTRKRLTEWGYTPRDITTFFALFSSQRDNTLNFQDFGRMINEMKLGLTERRIFDLFMLFDDDASGYIEPEEFVAILFPHAQIEMHVPGESEEAVDEIPQDVRCVDSLPEWIDEEETSL